jgi:ABC-type multidrug transport system ATPase subunit
VWERVLELRAEEDMTVLLTTHYLEEAEQLCDRVGLLLDGHLRAIGRPGTLRRHSARERRWRTSSAPTPPTNPTRTREACAMSAAPAARPAGSDEAPPAIGAIRLLWSRTTTLSLLELVKLRHDRTEPPDAAEQPAAAAA